MSYLLVSLILSMSAPTPNLLQEHRDKCSETFDNTEKCDAPAKTIFVPKAAEKVEKSYNEYPLVEDHQQLSLQFLAMSTAPALFAVGLHIVHFYYHTHIQSLNKLNSVNKEDTQSQLQVQNGLYWGSIGLWVSTALIAGTGAFLWVFDPKDGSLNPNLLD